jgi:Class II Aldolase and Adducin N-terminal domain
MHSTAKAAAHLATVSPVDGAQLRSEIAMVTRLLNMPGLMEYSGHVSTRLPGHDSLLIQDVEISRATVHPSDLMVCDLTGKAERAHAQAAVAESVTALLVDCVHLIENCSTLFHAAQLGAELDPLTEEEMNAFRDLQTGAARPKSLDLLRGPWQGTEPGHVVLASNRMVSSGALKCVDARDCHGASLNDC